MLELDIRKVEYVPNAFVVGMAKAVSKGGGYYISRKALNHKRTNHKDIVCYALQKSNELMDKKRDALVAMLEHVKMEDKKKIKVNSERLIQSSLSNRWRTRRRLRSILKG